VQWITDVAVPIVLGLLAAFGATWYSNKKNAQRLEREADDRAAGAVRAYIRALRDTSDYLEARALAHGDWDPTEDVISHGGQDAVRDTFTAAVPFFHRLQVRDEDKNPLRNEFPNYGEHPMEGSGNFHDRAKQIQAVLDRGLKR
jgi:type II secretory pathway pseudopilin PulG